MTALAVNLTIALRSVSQKSVLLIDWKRPLGDVAIFLGMQEKRVLECLLPHGDGVDEGLFADALTEYRPGVWLLRRATDPAPASHMNARH